MGEKFDPYYKWLGIPPKDQPPHHYRLLGIEIFEEDREVIDAAANRLMGYLKDLAVGDEGAHTQNLLNEISRARICLLNQTKKQDYDQQLRKRVEAEEARTPPPKGPPPKAKLAVPPPAAPPSAAAPPPTTRTRSDTRAPVIVIPDLEGASKTPATEGPDEEAFKIVPVDDKKPRTKAKAASAEPKAEPVETATPPKRQAKKKLKQKRKQKTEPAATGTSPVQVYRHPRRVYVAAILIAIVGAVGLILTVVMSYLLLTTDSPPAPPPAESAQVSEESSGPEESGSVEELPELEELPDAVPP
jgi:hypothetical protein